MKACDLNVQFFSVPPVEECKVLGRWEEECTKRANGELEFYDLTEEDKAAGKEYMAGKMDCRKGLGKKRTECNKTFMSHVDNIYETSGEVAEDEH